MIMPSVDNEKKADVNFEENKMTGAYNCLNNIVSKYKEFKAIEIPSNIASQLNLSDFNSKILKLKIELMSLNHNDSQICAVKNRVRDILKIVNTNNSLNSTQGFNEITNFGVDLIDSSNVMKYNYDKTPNNNYMGYRYDEFNKILSNSSTNSTLQYSANNINEWSYEDIEKIDSYVNGRQFAEVYKEKLSGAQNSADFTSNKSENNNTIDLQNAGSVDNSSSSSNGYIFTSDGRIAETINDDQTTIADQFGVEMATFSNPNNASEKYN